MFKDWKIASALVLGMTSAAQAEEHLVILTGFSYFPAVVYADPGDTVRFINKSGEPQIVVSKDYGWTIGPLQDQQAGTLVVNDETELAFFSAYTGWMDLNGDGENDLDKDNGTGNDTSLGDYGKWDDAPIKAEITFAAPPLNG